MIATKQIICIRASVHYEANSPSAQKALEETNQHRADNITCDAKQQRACRITGRMLPTNHLRALEGSVLLDCDAKLELVFVLQHPEAGRSGYQSITSLSKKSVCRSVHFST